MSFTDLFKIKQLKGIIQENSEKIKNWKMKMRI